MSVKVIKNKIFDGNKTHEVGDIITGLSEKDESQLISSGHIEYVYTKGDDVNTEKVADDLNVKVETLDKVEEITSDAIDPSLLALNSDDYAAPVAAKVKK